MPTFTHRPSFPADARSHERDRGVWYDGVHVGRAYHEVTAHRGHKWQWSALAADGHDAIGEADTLEEALELMEFRFRRHQVKVDKSGLKSVVAQASRNSLIQVLVNLFINAMHAMPDGGQLTLSLNSEGGKAVIRVRDSGSGIPEEILPKIMEPLFTTKGKDGSGLGLAICKEIIEMEHSGEFKIGNHPSGGAEVTLILPLSQEPSDE